MFYGITLAVERLLFFGCMPEKTKKVIDKTGEALGNEP